MQMSSVLLLIFDYNNITNILQIINESPKGKSDYVYISYFSTSGNKGKLKTVMRFNLTKYTNSILNIVCTKHSELNTTHLNIENHLFLA